MSLGSCDLLLPPAPIPSPTLISSAQETSEEFDDERRERWREERQCNCCEKDPNCRHFLTYDLFEVCLALREVYAKRKCLLPQERKSLCFSSSYHDWFIPPFAAWLAIVSEQVIFNLISRSFDDAQCLKIIEKSHFTVKITYERFDNIFVSINANVHKWSLSTHVFVVQINAFDQ